MWVTLSPKEIPNHTFFVQASAVPRLQEEEEVAEEEEEEPEQVDVENESYVNLKKKLSKKYDVQAKSLYYENVKICTQFRLKKV